VSLDWVETGVYYNKELFAQAGVDPANWTSWSAFVADMQTLKDATGVDPMGMYMQQTGWSNWVWADDIFLTVVWSDMADELYMEKYNDPNLPWRQLNPEEIAKAIVDGTLNAEDPRMDDYLRISKEFISFFPIDYTGITSLEQLNTLFFGGQVLQRGTAPGKPNRSRRTFRSSMVSPTSRRSRQRTRLALRIPLTAWVDRAALDSTASLSRRQPMAGSIWRSISSCSSLRRRILRDWYRSTAASFRWWLAQRRVRLCPGSPTLLRCPNVSTPTHRVV
jgi:hypothetical protein